MKVIFLLFLVTSSFVVSLSLENGPAVAVQTSYSSKRDSPCTEPVHKVELLNLFHSSGALFFDRKIDKYKILTEKYHEKVKIISVDLSIDISSPYVHDIIYLLETECVSNSVAVTCYIEDVKLDVPEVKEYMEGNLINTFPVNRKEYFFINNSQGIVIIVDANSHDIITAYEDSEFVGSSVAIVNNTFYNINTQKGVIKSIPMENIMTNNLTNWDYVGSFPSDSIFTKHAAVNGTHIYFISHSGILYSYDTILQTVAICGNVEREYTTSLIIVDNILYIFQGSGFYSFDGTTINPIALSDKRHRSGLFQMGKSVCVVGGNVTNTSPDPVYCYDPQEKLWKVSGFINEAREQPGVATSQSGVHIFGGYSWLLGGLTSSAELFNIKNQKWSYIPSPLSNANLEVETNYFYMQAVTFYS